MDLELLSDPSGDGVHATACGDGSLVYRLALAPRPHRALLWGQGIRTDTDGGAVVSAPKELPGDH